MLRKIIQIDESKCNGCGICANACHEAAIGIVDGKAKLLRDDYCDGMGDCLPACPTGAITFVEREAAAYDEKAVAAHKDSKSDSAKAGQGQIEGQAGVHHGGGCPGSRLRQMQQTEGNRTGEFEGPKSRLSNWPVQIKLLPINAPYFDGCNLLVAADCTAYSRGDFHDRFIDGRVTMVGCPKLDNIDYSEKLAQIFETNDIKSITLTRMTVPCCGGLEYMVRSAIEKSGENIPINVVTIDLDGTIVDESNPAYEREGVQAEKAMA
ncbi:MAG: ATP-binding protein [Coriobacteriales bacterium]|jgi:Fe-S-cluster-containing hydrogenase component 2